MSAAQTIAVQRILAKKFTEGEATELLDYVDEQKGDTATKQFVKQEIEGVKKDFKQEICGVKRDFKQEIDSVKRDVNWLKWIVGLGIPALLSVMLYLHGDTKKEMSDMRKEIAENRKLLIQILQKK